MSAARGELNTLTAQLVLKRTLVAPESVEQGGFFRRVWNSIRLFFKGLFG